MKNTMETQKRFQSEALQEVYEKIIGDDPQRQADFEQEVISVEAAQLIFDMRIEGTAQPKRTCQACWDDRLGDLPAGGR
jgi:hypothetical protein